MWKLDKLTALPRSINIGPKGNIAVTEADGKIVGFGS
jgi:hypothetical protein